MNMPLQTIGSKLIYIVLLIAFLVIGYLLGKVEALQKGTVAVAPVAPAAQQPQAPTAPNPSDVLSKLSKARLPIKGDANAKVKIVEFADFRCPFCEKFFTDSEPQIMKDYVDSGKASFEFRNYAFLGPASTVAANAAECANDQGKFWDYYEWLYKNQPPESDITMYVTDKLSQAAGTIGMDTTQFSSCLDGKKFDKNVSDDLALGQSVGVSGTPTFYVNGTQLVGAQPYASIKAVIDQELAKK
jgi:protein-disulfide isomerase